jgi:hypothetical protein
MATKTSELIPSTELTGIEKALTSVEALTVQLEPLREKAKKLEVTWPNKEKYAEIGQVLSEVRNLRKQGEAHFAPFTVIVERVKTWLRTQIQKHTNACEEIDFICRTKMKEYERRELEETQKEQKQVDRKAERNGEPGGKVAPNLPPVAGYRRSIVYRAELKDITVLLKAWAKGTPKHRAYLERFLTVDEKALNAEAREVKDPEKLMKLLPGTRAWKE